MSNEYNDPTDPHDDWPSWRRLVLQEIKDLKSEVKDLERQQHVSATEMAMLKLKVAGFVAFALMVASPLVSWFLDKIFK